MASVRKRQWKTTKGEPRSAWVVDFIDAAGRRDRRQFDTKRQADAFRVEIEGQLRAGTFRPEADRITIKEVSEHFIDHCRGRMERREKMMRSSFESYAQHVRNHFLHKDHGIGTVRLSQLTTGRVTKFRDDLRSAGVSVPTTRKIIGSLRTMLDFARTRDWISTNAASRVKVIGRRDEGSAKVTPPSKEALQALIKAASPRFRVVVKFAAATGVRASEMHALRWRHVDFGTGEVTIETRVDRYRQEDTTKTEAGMRAIPLGSPILAMLRTWRLESRFSRDDDLIFPNRKGLYEDHDNMSSLHFRPTREAAGVPEVTWHSLRHFAISCWIERGLSPKAVQTFAGHSSLAVTMDRYGHLFPSEDHRVAMDAIAGELFA